MGGRGTGLGGGELRGGGAGGGDGVRGVEVDHGGPVGGVEA